MLKGLDPLLDAELLYLLSAMGAYTVVATAEARPYGCFILKKGVVFD